jgi:signal transduction histidine kinase
MDIASTQEQVQRMMAIIHQIPMGVVEADDLGNVKEMNAKGVQLLLPIFVQEKLDGTNILQLLAIITPAIKDKIQAYAAVSGCIVDQQHEVIGLNNDGEMQQRHFFFTINRLAAGSYMFVFDDITALYEKEQLLNQIIQDKAIEQSKFEIASGVLHDIGNALVGFGSHLTTIKRSTGENDITTLENFKQFIIKHKIPIATAIGELKAGAMVELIEGIISSQQAGIAGVQKAIAGQMDIIAHIQDILNIQRQYVTGQNVQRAPVNLRNIINDSFAMLSASFDSKCISVTTSIPVSIPLIKGDRTKLMQVILNLLKNAVEAITMHQATDKSIHVSLVVQQNVLEISIKDSGIGFATMNGNQFFEKGVTSKTAGTGLGLANCKSIIESHKGTIQLRSDGPGKGATASLFFELQTNN